MKVIKKFLFIIIIILTLFTIFIVNGITESIIVNKKIDEFKRRGILIYEGYDTRYYRVESKYEYEDLSLPVVSSIFDSTVGATGDIFVTSRNPLPGSVMMGWVSKYTWIGHTGLVIDDNGYQTIEITGNLSPDQNVVRIWNNNWLNDDKTRQIAVLRVKSLTAEKRKQIVTYAKSKIGMPYNYTFLFNRANSYYCSDLVSRSIQSAGININYDYLATTGSDIIVSQNTYLVYYREKLNDGKFAVYYLAEED